MSNRDELEKDTIKDLHKQYLIESILDYRKSLWLNPSNIISAAALMLSLILAAMHINLSKINEKKSDLINKQTAVLLEEKAHLLDKINEKKITDGSESNQIDVPVNTKRLAAISKVTQGLVRKSGWLYLGQLNADGSSWKSDSPKTIRKIDFNDLKGAVIELTDDVYIRADTGNALKTHEKVVDAGLAGEYLRVVKIYESPAKNSGSFIWVKVIENKR